MNDISGMETNEVRNLGYEGNELMDGRTRSNTVTNIGSMVFSSFIDDYFDV